MDRRSKAAEADKLALITLIGLAIIGCLVSSARTMPGYAKVVIDMDKNVYYAPPYFTKNKLGDLSALDTIGVAQGALTVPGNREVTASTATIVSPFR